MAIRSAALTHALALAERGFCVFPLKPGEKRPVEGVSWPEVMTTDPDKIKAWFKDQPDMNYGVCPGDDAAVIDLDVKGTVNGADALAQIEGEQDLDDWLFDAMTVSTPSGGRHIYVTGTGLVGNSHRFPAGIDIRGARGYVVGPGCTVAGKPYTPENDAPPKPAPAWVKERLQPPRQKDVDIDKPIFDLDLPAAIERAREYLSHRGPAIEGFKGNEHTFVTAAQVKDLGVSMEQCLALMLEPGGWNDRCAPPWEPHEIAGIVSHAYQYGKDRAGSKGGLMELYDLDEGEDTPAPVDDHYSELRAITYRGAKIFTRTHRREMIIPEWLPAHGMVANLAKRGGGKTAVMLDMALRVCADLDWFGQPVAPGWAAVYLCGEDDVGAEEQIRAWCAVNEMETPPERFIFLAGVVDLLSAGETEKWTKYLLSEVLEGQRAMVFVDTWQRATGRGGQNKDEDMQLAVHHAEAMAKSLGGPSVVAFHPPKHDDRAVMGSSVIENATTAIWRISDQATARRLEVERIKGKGVGNYVTFTLDEVGLGQNDDFGRERTGVVVKKVGGTEYVLDPEVLEERRQIYAEVIRDLDLERKSLDPRSKHLSIRKVATRIAELADEAKQPDSSKARRAEAIISRLRQAGTVSFVQRTLEEHIRQLLGNDPRGHDFGDGYVLRALRDGKALRFAIERSGV